MDGQERGRNRRVVRPSKCGRTSEHAPGRRPDSGDGCCWLTVLLRAVPTYGGWRVESSPCLLGTVYCLRADDDELAKWTMDGTRDEGRDRIRGGPAELRQ